LRLAVFACPHHRHLGQPVLVVVAVVPFGVAAYALSDQRTKFALVNPAFIKHRISIDLQLIINPNLRRLMLFFY
jgi:hypothetical protein